MVFNIGIGSCVLSTGIKRANSGGYWKLPGQADKVDYFPFSCFLQLRENRLFAYAKTKAQISCAVTAQLISALVFAT